MKVKDRLRNGLHLRDALQSKSNAKMIINGHEILVKDYMLDPQKYNSLPMAKEYVEEIIQTCEQNKLDKAKIIELNHYESLE